MAEQLPAGVEQFISSHIGSLEQLEILLLLRGSPDHSWSSHEVYRKILSSEASVAERLETLVLQNLVSRTEGTPPTFRFQPGTPELATVVGDLAEAYHDRRIKVVETIFSKPISPIQSFADAFRIRKDKNDG